jgi:hypothetical protein
MANRQRMVTGMFRDRINAERAFDWLHAHGYPDSEISVLMSDKTRATYYAEAREGKISSGSKAGQGMGVGGAIGTLTGAALAAVAAIGTSLVVPGLGLVVAGPIAAALAGGGAGAVTGGLIGALVGWGIPEDNARAYQEALRGGGVVIGVVPRDNADASKIQQEFKDLEAEDVFYG